MKLIGLLGGVTWESTKEYYRIMNEEVKVRLGGWQAARCLIYSLNFHDVVTTQRTQGWDKLGDLVERTTLGLKAGGADFILLGANTMHKFCERVENATGLEVLHIADCTAEAIKKLGMKKVGLTGTAFTMEEEFIKGRLIEKHGLEVVIPNETDRQVINEIIFEELAKGVFKDDSTQLIKDMIGRLIESGAEGIILGCTELPLVIKPGDVSMPVFDTTEIHAKAAVAKALG